MKARRITGVRNTVSALNPIVRFVRTVAEFATIGLDVQTGKTLCVTPFDGRGQQVAALPEAVIAFLVSFHRGDYPDLEMDWSGR